MVRTGLLHLLRIDRRIESFRLLTLRCPDLLMRLSANTFLQAALVLEIAVACVVEVVAEANRRVPDVRGLHVDRTKVTHAQLNEELAQPALCSTTIGSVSG